MPYREFPDRSSEVLGVWFESRSPAYLGLLVLTEPHELPFWRTGQDPSRGLEVRRRRVTEPTSHKTDS